MVQLKTLTFADLITQQTGFAGEGRLTDFVSRYDGELYFGDRLNLNRLVRQHGAPLEVVYTPQITMQVQRMLNWAAQARSATEYPAVFHYAYATKANFAAEAVQTALAAGAHYETSATTDLIIAHGLWRQGILPRDRFIFCNGSKEPAYREAIRNIRLDGCETVIPVLDDLAELRDLLDTPVPLQFGVRERAAGNRDGRHPGNDRFGLTAAEIEQAADLIADTHHTLVLYHAMVGSQIEDEDHFLNTLRASVEHYCRLRRRVPTLRYFNFGGGMPTAGYQLTFSFDYRRFLSRLMITVRDLCAEYGVPTPELIGEFGRYTVATHSAYLVEVGAVKAGQAGQPDWYLVNGSLMVMLPDTLFVSGQEFVILPLTDWDKPIRPVRLAGRRTCDSDDIYPRPEQPPLWLPTTDGGLILAIFGIGAYQQMIAGRGGAHHCLTPEAARFIVEERNGRLSSRLTPQQDQVTIMRLLGYRPQPTALPAPLPFRQPVRPAVLPARRRVRERALLV
ncbi:arginine decarboxylase [Chloroflexus sp.]|uniref:arginine decarboxylase n=1 Tax=Chloroflexus sp. TaxID=1904827 RepID=UPI003C71CC84